MSRAIYSHVSNGRLYLTTIPLRIEDGKEVSRDAHQIDFTERALKHVNELVRAGVVRFVAKETT